MRRALRHARMRDDAAPLRKALGPLKVRFARSEEDAAVLKAAKASAGRPETPTSDLMAAVQQVRNTPGCAADMSPADKRAIWDKRREHVVRSCCYVWHDAGRTVSYTTDPVQGTRTGRLVNLIQTVVAMVTDPPGTLSGETIRKDIERFKEHLEEQRKDPNGILKEPTFGPS